MALSLENFHGGKEVKVFVSGKKAAENESKKMAHSSVVKRWASYGVGVVLLASTLLSGCSLCENQELKDRQAAIEKVTTVQKDSLELTFDKKLIDNFDNMTVPEALEKVQKDMLSKSDTLTTTDHYIKHYAEQVLNNYNNKVTSGTVSGGAIGSTLGDDNGMVIGGIIGNDLAKDEFKKEFKKNFTEKQNKQKTLVLDAAAFNKYSR